MGMLETRSFSNPPGQIGKPLFGPRKLPTARAEARQPD
jgi:hypothetical protein